MKKRLGQDQKPCSLCVKKSRRDMSLTYYLCCTGFVEKVRFESLNSRSAWAVRAKGHFLMSFWSPCYKCWLMEFIGNVIRVPQEDELDGFPVEDRLG